MRSHSFECDLKLILVAGVVYNVFEAVDVITLIKGGVYDDLSLTVGEALKKRSPVGFHLDGYCQALLTCL